MSNEVIVSEQYTSAVSLNQRIKAHAHAAHESLLEVCKGLKEMRDGKLYKELGYQNFEDYTENEVGFTRQQAYRYIGIVERLPVDFVNSSLQNVGVNKLYLLSALTEEERTELTQTTDLENTTVKELKMQIKTLKNDKERLREESCSNAKKAAELKEDTTRRLSSPTSQEL